MLDTKLVNLVGGKTADAVRKAFGYETVWELLWHVPRRYQQRGELTTLAGLPVGEEVTIVAEVSAVRERRMQRRSGNMLEVVLSDGTGTLSLTFFNQAWRLKELVPGTRGIFAGKVGMYNGQRQLTHPDYELFADDLNETEAAAWAERPIPIYPATARVPSWRIAKIMALVLDALPSKPTNALPGDDRLIPDGPIAKWGDTDISAVFRSVHQPATAKEWKNARESLRDVEALLLLLALAQRRARHAQMRAVSRQAGALLEQLDGSLPWSLTEDQRNVGEAISAELAAEVPMHRLLQGEVGSGKTLVALRAMLTVAESGGQSAMLAPTEVLAAQHYRSIVEALGHELTRTVKPVLLTGSLSTSERRSALLRIAGGEALIVVGTHALLSERVTFADLGFVVVDEQHRFGVEQRQALRDKSHTAPHTLVLTATPIPRTVAMTAFGDVEVSTLRQLPAGRQGIETHVVPLAEKPGWIDRVWQRVAEEVASGRQVFVVAPAIEPGDDEYEGDVFAKGADEDAELSDSPDLKIANVTEVAATLSKHPHTQGLRIATLHGRLPSAEKDATMTAFADGQIDVLVATTVIEVGVNVPNASTMVVLDADRFGIAQLHQLRGRVGRGEHKGLCLLVTRAFEGTTARERVAAVSESLDGFELAERDLELRREGDVLGQRQSGGRSQLRVLRVTKDQAVIDRMKAEADQIVAADPELSVHPALAAMLRRMETRADTEFLTKS